MADVDRERVTALWREAAAAVESPRCTCTEDESSDGSATYEDDPHCPTHGWCSWRAECGRLREQLAATRKTLAEELEQKAEAVIRAGGLRGQLDAARQTAESVEAESVAVRRGTYWKVAAGEGTTVAVLIPVAEWEALRAALGVEGEQE